MHRIFISVILLLFCNAALASQNGNMDYVTAYKSCSPTADANARKQCNYGPAFESYYLECMRKYGYSDPAAAELDGYVQAYKYCSSVSDSQTKENCNYGTLYHQQYNQCLRQYGFDGTGERMSGDKPYFKFDF